MSHRLRHALAVVVTACIRCAALPAAASAAGSGLDWTSPSLRSRLGH